MLRRLRLLLPVLLLSWPGMPALAGDVAPTVQVYKSPTCGCCDKWIEHLRAEGFAVEATDVSDLRRVKAENGVPPRLTACHTAFVGGYYVEGHVPASDVARLLEERPAVAGLAVPGMPEGSPGMEGPDPERYDVLAVERDGSVRVFSTHGP